MTRRNKALVNELSTPPAGANDLYFPTQFSQPSWEQFQSCLWKQWWTYWRSPDYNLVRFFFTLAAALLVGSIFWDIGSKMCVLISKLNYFKLQLVLIILTIKVFVQEFPYTNFLLIIYFSLSRESSSDLTMVIGAMYAAVFFVGFDNCTTVQPVVAIERTVFYRERAAGMYSPLPYALAQVKGE